MKAPLKILILEDSPTDAEILKRFLTKEKMDCTFMITNNKKTYLHALDEFQPDIILSDHSLPQFNSLDALNTARKKTPGIPFIMVTGSVSEDFASNIIKAGADDYILKDRINRLPAAIDAALKLREAEKEKQQTLQKLIQSEKKYRTIFFKSPLPKWIYDAETLQFLEVNDAAVRHYGYSQEEFLNMTIKDIRPKEDVKQLLHDINNIIDDTNSRHGNWRHLKKNGEIIMVETTAHHIDYNGRKARMVVVNDVTQRIQSEQQKEFDNNNLSSLINNTHDMMWSIDKDMKLITFNDSFKKVLKLSVGKTFKKGEYILSDKFTKAQLDHYKKLYQRALSGETFTIIDHFESPHEFWSEVSFYPIRKGNEVIGTACFSRDITDRKRNEENLKLLEKKILEQKIQEHKKIARAIIKAQEKERNHIGQELHDNINQILAGTKLYLGVAGKKNKAVEELIKYPMELIDSSIEEIRLLCNKMVTPLKNIDLEELIKDLVITLDHNTITKTNFSYCMPTANLSDDLKLNIFRIIQELVNNIWKYAEAKNVKISIQEQGEFIRIDVSDDGKGFDVEKKRGGIGLSNIINRVESFNGEIEIKSSAGKGCRTMIRIPY